MVSDKHERPLHPLVELFVDNQNEAYPADEEKEDTVSSLSLLGLLREMKEGWGDQAGTKPQLITDRVATREKLSTSHIARKPLKLPEINIINKDFKYEDTLEKRRTAPGEHGQGHYMQVVLVEGSPASQAGNWSDNICLGHGPHGNPLL